MYAELKVREAMRSVGEGERMLGKLVEGFTKVAKGFPG